MLLGATILFICSMNYGVHSLLSFAENRIEKQTVPQQSTVQQIFNEWSHFRVLTIDIVRKLCMMHGFILGVEGLISILLCPGKQHALKQCL